MWSSIGTTRTSSSTRAWPTPRSSPSAARQADESCFCTSVGSRPDDTQGSDILLSRLKAGGFVAEVLTDKGKALVALAKDAFQPLSGTADVIPPATVVPAFDAKALEQKLAGKFDSPAVAGAEPALPGLRRLRLRVPDLRVLRHSRRGRHQARPAPARLGQLRHAHVHPARLWPQPARQTEPALAPARLPQVRLLPRPLHGRWAAWAAASARAPAPWT
jgi:hypothetical protein